MTNRGSLEYLRVIGLMWDIRKKPNDERMAYIMGIFIDDQLAKKILKRCEANGTSKSSISLEFEGYGDSVINHCCIELAEAGAVNHNRIRNLDTDKCYPTSITVNGRDMLNSLSKTWKDKVLDRIIAESGKIFWGLMGAGITALITSIVPHYFKF